MRRPDSEFALSNSVELQLLQGHALEALAIAQHNSGARGFYDLATTEHSLGPARESQQAHNDLIDGYGRAAPYQVAEVYACAARRTRPSYGLSVPTSSATPVLCNLHADPRFADMVRKMNLPE